jgi:hypothetical protein
MKLKNSKPALIAVAVITAVISLIIASTLFNSPAKHNLKTPVVPAMPSSFPDINNDPAYNTFLNEKALDATQPVQIGNSQNNAPFNQ